MNTLYITGAGVSAESGIPTFRGRDGFWTFGSKNYTPQQMATREMYQQETEQFLCWYYHRFVTYRDHGPSAIHHWLADKNLITQNIDGLDGKAGNKNYIPIHGRLDKMTLFHRQDKLVEIIDAPWDDVDEYDLPNSLLKIFNITGSGPELYKSYKPYVLLFDEYYTELYRITEAQQRMKHADRIIFIGTSFSVNITQIALEIAAVNNIPVEIVDPEPVNPGYPGIIYHQITASEYIRSNS